MKREQRSFISTISAKTMLPLDTILGYPYYQVYGNREMIIEGVYKLSEYNSELIAVNVGKMKLKIVGRNLKLDCLTEGNMIVKGFIISINYE